MKRFFSFIIRQSVAIILIVLLVLGFGVFSALKMDINLLPDINVPIVCAQVVYPGANASSVESDVTEKLEGGLGSISGITDIESYSYDNLSAVVLSFDYGTDTNEKKNDIQSKINSLDLPDGVTTSVYNLDLNGDALAVLSVVSKDGADAAYAKARKLSEDIAAIEGVESVEVKGGASYSYKVQPYGGFELLSPLLVQTFSYGALNIPLGNISSSGTNVQIRNDTTITSVDDIKNSPIVLDASVSAMLKNVKTTLATLAATVPHLIGTYPHSAAELANIKSLTGVAFTNESLKVLYNLDSYPKVTNANGETEILVKVKDVATVKEDAAYTSYAYYKDGGVDMCAGIIIEVYKSNGANSSSVVDKVKDTYKGVTDSDGITVTLLDDSSSFISDSISNVLVSMLVGGALAVVVIFLFLKRIKTSLIIAVTMPLSVLAAIICMFLSGITLNMVSLGGLAVGIGMLVDNSIVVIEAISKHRDSGKSAFAAAVDGTVEVGGALLGSTLTTVCVFIPIIFSGGLTAEIFTDLAFAVIFSLAFSLIVALTVIPALYAMVCGDKRLLKGGKPSSVPLAEEKPEAEKAAEAVEEAEVVAPPKQSKLKTPFIMNGINKVYSKILPKVLGKRLVTILVAVGVFGASIGFLFLTGTEFLPSIDKGQIEVNMSYGSGKSLETVQEDVLGFSNVISENIENIDYISASVGKNGLLALTDTGVITVQLKSNKNTEKTVNAIRSLAAEHETVGTVTVKQIDGVVASLTSGASDMSVSIVGSDGEVLKEIAAKIRTALEEANFTDITDSATEKSKQYTFNFDREKLAKYGVDYQDLVTTLRIGLASYTACTVTIDGQTRDLKVSFADGAITSKQELEDFIIGFSGTERVFLRNVLVGESVIEEEVETCLRRSGGNKVITVSAVLAGKDTGTATDKMEEIAEKVLKEYDGYSFESGGISSYLSDAFSGLAVALVISFFLLYAVMAIQFSSFIKPLIIMASIPFCFTGGFLALVITGTSLNVVSFIGLIMLMGVIVNNAIVMLEKIKQLHAEGMPHYDAVIEACKVRLRPILMTTVTTILALIPLAIGIGKGSELMQPLGIVVIGGLLLGTLVTLVLVPTVYCAVNRLKKPEKEKVTKEAKVQV